jgi:phosphoribosyl-ATP pyrophosphohydrolase/phosphoribosyl-AMP cyclohydrolase
MSQTPNFEKLDGLIPAIVQDNRTGMVLMLGFMNTEAYYKTLNEGLVTFYSRTKRRLWTKGEESGNCLKMITMQLDCDCDTVLIEADPAGPVCHTGTISCFGEKAVSPMHFLSELQELLKSRKKEKPEGSYTAELFRSGTNAIARKLGEESVELIIESKEKDDRRFLDESADLLFHFMLLLIDRGYDLSDVAEVLKKRHPVKGQPAEQQKPREGYKKTRRNPGKR